MSGMSSPPSPQFAAEVKAVRGFNRFYTQRAGVLDPYLCLLYTSDAADE